MEGSLEFVQFVSASQNNYTVYATDIKIQDRGVQTTGSQEKRQRKLEKVPLALKRIMNSPEFDGERYNHQPCKLAVEKAVLFRIHCVGLLSL